MADQDIVIKYENDFGSQVKIALGDEKEFVINAARVKPVPLAKQVEAYVKTAGLSVWHHPTDVTTAMFLGTALAGGFDWVNADISGNAKAVMRLPVEALGIVYKSPLELRLALQMLLIYQQTDLRGRALLALTVRMGTGLTLSNWIFSLGGRVKGGKLARGAAIGALSMIGSLYRLSLKMFMEGKTVMDSGLHPFLSAIITGEDHILNLAQELGTNPYDEIT